jgi:aryl-alcohol dehydrogenase-like predicted oxidoreductase
MSPQLISGNINNLDPDELRTTLKDADISRLDTAARYMNGESERKLGSAKFPKTFFIDTKIKTDLPADGTLTAENIEKSLLNSLDVLDVEKVNVLYCHAPDKKTPIAEQARAFDEHYREGRFTHVRICFSKCCAMRLTHYSSVCPISQTPCCKNGYQLLSKKDL